MDRIDIVENGSKIFLKIFEDFAVSEITDLHLLEEFLNKLLSETKGLVIFDFLDHGNWDCFGSFSIDYERGFVVFNWFNYTGFNDIDSFINKSEYKPSVVSLMLHFKELKIENRKDFPFITLRGYALKQKDTLKYFRTLDSNATYLKSEKANFCNTFQIDRGKYFEECYCYDTPIYSILIIPKDTASDTTFSSKVLFLYNYNNCRERIKKIEQSIFTKKLDEDELCEKANSIRRIFEFVLKIECCYHKELNYEVILNDEFDTNDFNFKSNYSDISLGDLVNILKKLKSDTEKETLNRIVRLSNELSHDSGIKVTEEKVHRLLEIMINYTAALTRLLII
ncbi:MAG: hypothetical protein JSR97_07090 [Verrucomicrobia bacterium]|nr:hypothetical protein [Verrucomicrobiota bacterium]